MLQVRKGGEPFSVEQCAGRWDQNNRANFGTNTDEPQRLQRFYRLADAGLADAQPFDELLFRGQLLARLYLATLDEVKDMVDKLET